MNSTGSEQYKVILDAASDGIWDWNIRADRLYLDTRYCELIGYSPDETIFDRDFMRKIAPSVGVRPSIR